MKKLKVAASTSALDSFSSTREVVDLFATDFTDVGAVVMTASDIENGALALIDSTGFDIPLFAVVDKNQTLSAWFYRKLRGVIDLHNVTAEFFGKQIDHAACEYEAGLLPPFFANMADYVDKGNVSLSTPGHNGGQFFRQSPAGRRFYDFFGETLFRADMASSEVKLGDLLIHEGAACEAQQHAARVFNADKTYFVLNGTSSSNKVVLNALLTRGDLVLFDRNNHKSVHHGALLQAGATPVYLETARNPFGFIGGIDAACFKEDFLRAEIRKVAPERADAERPFRLAIIQLGTYDGCIYNARQVVDKIGHLCDYILFDSAWVGYEQFIPMMKDCSPLLLELGPDDPGILVTQSVHKLLAGLSQASQIHKKDRHIKGQARYCNHKHMNNAFMLHASTSPSYPIFASLDVNAQMHEGAHGKKMWLDAVKVGIETRKLIFSACTMIKPFVPPMVDGKLWQHHDTDLIAQDLRFFKYVPGEQWHAYQGFEADQYFVDPCKLLLTTPGIDIENGQYGKFGIPATILCSYLREHGITPEKSDLNSILFLITPASNLTKMQHLVALLTRFEQLIADDVPLAEVLPSIYQANEARYRGYTIRRLCQEMHDIYVGHNIKDVQKKLFRKATMPDMAKLPQDAHIQFVRDNVELVPLSKIEGRIAAEGALPYPPGIICIVPGEVWGKAVLDYFRTWESVIAQLPGFAPELQGVYCQLDERGEKRIFAYVLKQ
ncbi:ornithine decarboxylase [Paludibacterium purpuratum]|uniref:ornithine decarboxylase n=1 Tax=Paludibacterium purpuratum TaxID=1144873 RepID=A0A4R7B2T3_9NEIS|nr:ornithine decarboxylase [Paludibacterium purpuratum]TDR77841.1 ornithine decarboxylase [Paludibacterium purpuratum]